LDKATRVLTLLTRLINGDVVKTGEFSGLAGVSSKSIQRDINDLNTFFYESDYWNNKNTKAIYSRALDGYTLSNTSYSNDSLALLSLLIKIQSLTPILHVDVYNLFQQQIANYRIEDKYILKHVLNHFKIRSDKLPGRNLMKLQESIEKKLQIRIELQDKMIIKPLTLMYMHYDYWLTYEFNLSIHTVKVRDIKSVRLLESTFENVKHDTPVKFEIDLSIWQQFKQQFSVKQVLEHKDGKVIAPVSCTELDSYYIAYQLAPLARMLGPQSYIDSFIQRLDTIKNMYC
jgi:predicted DNA-binding transcriptional regulator YafY